MAASRLELLMRSEPRDPRANRRNSNEYEASRSLEPTSSVHTGANHWPCGANPALVEFKNGDIQTKINIVIANFRNTLRKHVEMILRKQKIQKL